MEQPGRTATVNIAKGIVDTPGGRNLTISNYAFEIADMAPKPKKSNGRGLSCFLPLMKVTTPAKAMLPTL